MDDDKLKALIDQMIALLKASRPLVVTREYQAMWDNLLRVRKDLDV